MVTALKREYLTGQDVAGLLGLHWSTVVRFLERGWLKGRVVGSGGGKHHAIDEEDLWAFLESPAHWHRWQPERIADKGYRSWCEEMREGIVYLTTQQVAERLGYHERHISYLIRQGKLKAKLDGKAWRVLERDLEHFDPSAKGALSDQQRNQIAQLVLLGYRAAGIARLLNRPYRLVREYANTLEEYLPDETD